MRHIRWAAASIGSLILIAGTAQAAPDTTSGATVVRTDTGLVRGTATDSARIFQAIPYAAPPVDALRWRNPEPATPWKGERDATEPAHACPQVLPGLPAEATAEDCLYLNVTTPPRHGDRPKPVVFWIHGGVFVSGAGNYFDAERLARRGDVVVVSINYRLGMLGFLGLPGLPGSGTFGLADQQAALRWVQRNIGAFGGDPHNVTIAGQSAGAMSACAQLTSPSAAGLFQKAILQSGSCDVNWPDNFDQRHQPAGSVFRSRAAVEDRGRRSAVDLGCDRPDAAAVADCLRRLPVEKLKPALADFAHPAYGTPLLPSDPAEAVKNGRFQRVPVISGTTRNEATLSAATYDDAAPMSDRTYDAVLTETFGADRAAVETVYPRTAYGSAAEAFAAIVTDRKWACTQYGTSRDMAAHTPVRQYEFADPVPPSLPGPVAMPMGAYHTSDLPSLFDLGGQPARFSPEQQVLADRMVDYWASFAATGDPNGPGRPQWPVFRAQDDPPHTQVLAPGRDGIARVDLAAEHHCDFWAGLRRGG
ncbi:carboxylesterase family protein [Nocardia nova SH22a]|uniref:Carboxylic ester hydrolase n=1 Tax=Nocardia nova SH22a TaxID=1415166 RepID=W5THM0_9NOCA|nr:carboxylesterase/lipase family protein [Nocardia nova]AHH18659.1 carboxylesterase family protein [Nocardia nova SH22a]